MAINLDRLVFDPTNAADGASVGAYLRSSDGTLLTHTNNGGKQSLDVNVSNTSIAVTATNLDIRDLTAASDSVSISDGTDTLAVNADGSINTVTTIDLTYDFAEDAAHTNGDVGAYILNVRQDTLASSTSADGDYQSFKSDALGRLRISEARQSGAYAAVSVGNTATDLIATDLVNRTMVLVQNTSNRDVFIGTNSSVTTSNGIRLSAGSSIEIPVTAAVNLHGITASGTADVRTLELV